ncbi:MAG: heavy-metal-associated domain-containing protein [Microbacteriaceae bacterium]
MTDITNDLKLNDLGLTDLGLTEKSSGGGCACCASTPTDATTPADGETATTALDSAEPVSTALGVTGMTCGHCVSSVTEELSEIDGVTSVSVQLNVGGASTVTVESSSPLDPAAVRAAIDEAGYTLAEV